MTALRAAFVIAAASASAGAGDAGAPDPSSFYADVVGSDTLRDVSLGTEIRLYGADACEFSQRARSSSGQSIACEIPARAMLIEWTADRPISCRARSIDRCGRVLATCSSDEVPVFAASLIEQGVVAVVFRYKQAVSARIRTVGTSRQGRKAGNLAFRV
ncbi:MAG: hypothetical protein EOQ63_15325 [Mesorhizobium sp.]|uniref:thermonuclease family protein n=1 Tax=Mesorhizobium sp. TaxID=1871066 RepID=UPI000FE93C8C|nr:hypothetical protein [Mesorhizobium sp.]RWG47948.1 MAG: hypothetical protein EOQ63_15325 [Mesorhizobium sp.]TIR02321.1 MAG: hypothetical protein E5X32_27830 [Mesorhizobium sp.]